MKSNKLDKEKDKYGDALHSDRGVREDLLHEAEIKTEDETPRQARGRSSGKRRPTAPQCWGGETWVSFKVKGRSEGRGKGRTRQDGKVGRGQLRRGLVDHGWF